jgi:diguanylate cyclase (GGDEF)-like protein/PAS domain S-box-containing protein
VTIAAAEFARRREANAYVIAAVATAGVVAIRYSLLKWIGAEAPLLLFIVPIVWAACRGGLKPGLAATALSLASGVYFFIEHTGFWIHQPMDIIRLALLLAVGGGVSWACEAFHRQLAETKRLEASLRKSNEQVLQTVKRLRESEEWYRVLTEISPQTVWASRPDGDVDYCNQHWRNYSGLSMDQTKGTGWIQAVRPDLQEHVLCVWLEASQNGSDYEMEIPFRRGSDGTFRWHLAKGLPLKNEYGQVTRWIGIAIDIHDHRQVQQLEEYRRQLEEANARLALLAATDGLTRLHNRRAFQERLSYEVQRAARDGTPLSLLMLDVDHFKQFNDQFGHPAGDSVLRGVAKLLEETARSTDFVARYGGEEFAVLLPNTPAEGAMVVAERFRRAVKEGHWQEVEITVSVGAATLLSGAGGATLVEEADAALYLSKRSGRNCARHASQLHEPRERVSSQRDESTASVS